MNGFMRYLMLCCALGGTHSFAVGFASFFVQHEGTRIFLPTEETVQTVEQRIAWTLLALAPTLVEYRYFLVRSHYRLRYKTILAISTLIAVTLGIAVSRQPSLNILVFLCIWAYCIYKAIWPIENQDQVDR